MEGKPLISIALCTYNGSDFIKEQLDSILDQSINNWEIIIVDDCSQDETQAILKSYALRDTRFIIHYNDSNLGYNKNFEKALKLCQGEFIAICDQDDIWDKDKLKMQLDAVKENLLIYHDSVFIDRSGKSMETKISDKFNFYRGGRPEVFLYLNCVSGHSIFMRNSVLPLALPFPEKFHYDQWLAYIATTHGTIDFVDQALVRYRQHGKNNTDILALKSVSKNKDQKLEELERESEWLWLCAQKASGATKALITRLYTLSIKRNKSVAGISYGLAIWDNKELLTSLLRKSNKSKFFWILRKIWGGKTKQWL
ncbi:MAG: glycosyltransferase family 2 protein [Dyadobacter sp.]|uniref:glycosyltransferase family 2 protein n=1 Tax=Dyadobacter sp. TaxID=1914288 RepID=UPI003266687D